MWTLRFKKSKDAGLPGNVEGFAADLGTSDGVARIVAKYPDVEILVNNLGIFEPKPFEQIPDADWFRFFEVNVLSGVRLSRHYLPRMMERGWGRIVFISSESAVQIPAEMIHYGMTKTAQLAISRGLAEITAGTNVTVNTVLPGPTDSEGVATFVEPDGGRAKDEPRTSGTGILPQRAPFISSEALRARRRSCRAGGFCLQSVIVGYQRSGPQGRRRRGPVYRLA